MSKHTIKGYITFEQPEWSNAPKVDFYTYKPSAEYHPYLAIVEEHSFTVDVPDNFNAVPTLVANLEEQKRLLRLKLASELAEIDQRISKLTCLTNDVTEAA